MQDTAELLERHPELRLRFVSTRKIHEANRSRRINSIGGYDWWRIEAFDHEARSGVSVSFFRGDPFNVRYRQAVNAHRRGHLPDSSQARPAFNPAVHILAIKDGRVAGLSCMSYPSGAFRERPADAEGWSVDIGANQLAAYGDGWSVSASGRPSRLGLRGLVRPGVFDECEVNVRLSVEPRFHTTTIQRASTPDSASGATHDWLLACPSALVSGKVEVRWPRETDEIELTEAIGAVDHLWGQGPIGEGHRRWYRSRLSWGEGAAVAEMAILQKFIQLAGTLMIFRPDEIPLIMRCERPPTTIYQRGQWLLAYPMDMTWRDLSGEHELTQTTRRPTRMAPHRAFFFSRVKLDCGEPPDELVIDDGAGLFEILQPKRLDWPIWRPWIRWRR